MTEFTSVDSRTARIRSVGGRWVAAGLADTVNACGGDVWQGLVLAVADAKQEPAEMPHERHGRNPGRSRPGGSHSLGLMAVSLWIYAGIFLVGVIVIALVGSYNARRPRRRAAAGAPSQPAGPSFDETGVTFGLGSAGERPGPPVPPAQPPRTR